MDTRKALLVKSLRELLIITAKNASRRYPRGKDQNINKPYVEDTSEKIRLKLKSYKIRSIVYTENTLPKPLCEPKTRVPTKDKSNIVYEIDCSNCEAVCFDESKRSLK